MLPFHVRFEKELENFVNSLSSGLISKNCSRRGLKGVNDKKVDSPIIISISSARHVPLSSGKKKVLETFINS